MVRVFCYFAAVLACLACTHAAADTLLVEFTTAGCAPCRAMRPVISRLAAEGLRVREVDASREPHLAAQYKVDVFPTFLVLVDGHERARCTGVMSREQIVEMISKAKEISASGPVGPASTAPTPDVTPIPSGAPLASVDLVGARRAVAQGPMTFIDGSGPARIVEIQDPTSARPATARGNQASVSGPPAASSNPGLAPPAVTPGAGDVRTLIAATVRLTIEDPDGRSTGTGTIVDARGGEALVLTCGHLFRSSAGKGKIQLELFSAGPNGAELRTTLPGVLVDYDLDRDLALVRLATKESLSVAPIAPMGTRLEPGAAVTSVGCDNGADPTPWSTEITAINRYQGHPNIEAGRAPVEGRSGGGLFNAQGQLIGVCNAADPQGNEGLYASLTSIQQKLDSLQLAKVYQAPSGVGMMLASASAPAAGSGIEVRGQNPTSPPPSFPGSLASAQVATNPPDDSPLPAERQAAGEAALSASAAAPQVLSGEERAALEEIKRRSVGAEVICIIRPKSPDGRSDVIKLSNVSPGFVDALNATAAASGQQRTAAAPASDPAAMVR